METIIRQYVHRPNTTELGLGNTHETYLLVNSNIDLTNMFPPNSEVKVEDTITHKLYTLMSVKDREFRVNKMGEIYRDYEVKPGDEIQFTQIEKPELSKLYFFVSQYNRVVLSVDKKGVELSNEDLLKEFSDNEDRCYKLTVYYRGDSMELIIKFRGSEKKRKDSPNETDFFDATLNNVSLTSGTYYLTISDKSKSTLADLPKCSFNETKFDDCLMKIPNGEKSQMKFPLQQILFGAPGTGKSHTINSDANITEQNSIRTTFHPDSDYSTFVGCYKPTKDEKSGEITYDFTPQAFTNAYVAAWKDLGNPFYLIIEEINRGNCAQIFGDIFQLLDRNEQGYSSYKTTPDQDLMNYIKTQFSETNIGDAEVKSGKKMQLPPNLHIWATMNTSDQSLFPIDSAFKRRWDWRYIPIDYTDNGHYIDCGDTQYSWADFLQKVNDKVESVTQSEDKKLGYWFMGNGAEQKEITVDRFVSKVVFYLWNDVFKDFGKSGNTIFKDSFGKFHLFFDSSGKPKKDVVKAFLDALDVKSGEIEAGDPESETSSNRIDNTKYTFDGQTKLSKKALGEKIVLKYLKQNPNLSFEQIRNIFTFDNSVETPYQYKGIIAKTEDITNERAYSAEHTSSDGVKYKILTWWNKYNINFIIKFAEAQGWSITEEQK